MIQTFFELCLKPVSSLLEEVFSPTRPAREPQSIQVQDNKHFRNALQIQTMLLFFFETLSPIKRSINLKRAQETPKVTKAITRIPLLGIKSCPEEAKVPKSPTARVPQIPHTKCTEIAPTGSSTLNLLKSFIEKTTKIPAIKPITSASTKFI